MNAWWKRRTLRVRLAAWYGIVGTLLLAAVNATQYFYVRERMARPLGQQLERDLSEIKQQLVVQPDGRLIWHGSEIPADTAWTTSYPWFELWDENNHLVRRFWPFTEDRVRQLPGAPTPGRETISVFNVAPDIRLRVLNVPYHPAGRPTTSWMLRAIRIHEPVADALGALRGIILVTLPVVIALLVIGGYYLTRRWLMPLDHMASEANRISADDLARRLPVDNPHDELGRLAQVFNITLDRLEASFSSLDRFVADASHELRTPLTTLRSVGEVGLRKDRSKEEYREIISSMLEEAQRLQLLVGRLLELATAEGGAPNVHRTELKVDEYVVACANELAVLAEARDQHLVIDTVPCHLKTDAVIFRQALQNLIDNATKYSPEGSTIQVTVRDAEGAILVEVTDEGPGISPEDQTNLAKRFFRPDRGRGRLSGGFGLGLSITKAYMRVLGGELRFRAAKPIGTTFTLVFSKI